MSRLNQPYGYLEKLPDFESRIASNGGGSLALPSWAAGGKFDEKVYPITPMRLPHQRNPFLSLGKYKVRTQLKAYVHLSNVGPDALRNMPSSMA